RPHGSISPERSKPTPSSRRLSSTGRLCRKTWSCGHPPAMPGGCLKSAAVPCSCRPITGRWHSGTFAFDRWSDVRSGYMLLFGAEGASPKVWYPRNVNGPIRPTGICLLTVQHKAGGGDCRADEMVSNVFHDFGPLVATEPAQKRFSGRLGERKAGQVRYC